MTEKVIAPNNYIGEPEECPYWNSETNMCGWHNRICIDTNGCVES